LTSLIMLRTLVADSGERLSRVASMSMILEKILSNFDD
jgi:hypothetical protein